MRILFLDIDGVLNSSTFFQKMIDEGKHHTNETLDPEAVRILNTIVSKTGCKIVISSSWRLCNTQQEITDTLWRFGLRGFKNDIIGMTPDISLFDRRGEIMAWIHDHPEATSYCALDDIPIKLPFWVEVNPKTGLNDEYFADLVLNCFKRQERYVHGHSIRS